MRACRWQLSPASEWLDCTVGAQPGVAQAAAAPAGPPVVAARMPLPGDGALSSIPGDGNLLALTLDDGVNTDVVRLYTQFAKDTGVRLTYFVSGTVTLDVVFAKPEQQA